MNRWQIARLVEFHQGKMDLQTLTEHRRMDQKQTRSGEFPLDTVINRPCPECHMKGKGRSMFSLLSRLSGEDNRIPANTQ